MHASVGHSCMVSVMGCSRVSRWPLCPVPGSPQHRHKTGAHAIIHIRIILLELPLSKFPALPKPHWWTLPRAVPMRPRMIWKLKVGSLHYFPDWRAHSVLSLHAFFLPPASLHIFLWIPTVLVSMLRVQVSMHFGDKSYLFLRQLSWGVKVNPFSWTDHHIKRMVLTQSLGLVKMNLRGSIPCKMLSTDSKHAESKGNRFWFRSRHCMNLRHEWIAQGVFRERKTVMGRFRACAVQKKQISILLWQPI
jgi:hypothetical protein